MYNLSHVFCDYNLAIILIFAVLVRALAYTTLAKLLMVFFNTIIKCTQCMLTFSVLYALHTTCTPMEQPFPGEFVLYDRNQPTGNKCW